MKHTFFILFLALALFIGQQIHAQGIGAGAGKVGGSLLPKFKSFGGKITSITMPGITCAGYGVLTITPVGTFPATPYSIFPTPGSILKPPSIGGWILGLYNPVIAPKGCFTDSTPPTPYSTFSIFYYGASKRPSF